MYEMYVGAAQLITAGRTAMPSYTCPIDVDSSVAQTVGELVDALDRSRCVVEGLRAPVQPNNCLSAGASDAPPGARGCRKAQ